MPHTQDAIKTFFTASMAKLLENVLENFPAEAINLEELVHVE